MNPHLLEREIEHLETVVRYISGHRRGIPLRYWQQRVEVLSGFADTHSLRSRVQTLRQALAAMQSREAA
ncbi:hypothetical protein [Paraburkholderia caballeronis]|uniref:Uncharacterized protein n=1 Tax=Paraburkholderia caballeronis TaxID=416943 RepID=A0A1H7T412_9BURK|nr:hypothetical protein [Paraburkholderia caballeronis]PXW22737.1 hypothetical protein C7403_113131 [Paraburkholderia caballeronis]PXW96840.1 hypothetical protein C7407_113131 [Paraburkholderia caballeronis]RAJ93467.1 hypothetical protein C7409_113131 [Paraburkholderia caballeronis]TDV32820.1 hypothetical protein C7405_112132 [Paraburkholderia caballeronis]SEC73417.1 hypothetical protein SAMN05445871_2767 [Paraburkholderia caballeronis]